LTESKTAELQLSPSSAHALLSTAEMRTADRLTVARGIASWDLMQAAGRAVAVEARRRWDRPATLVICGPGNNGGDGFVAAEDLRRAGWQVRVALLGPISALTGDAARAAGNWSGPVEPLSPDDIGDAGLVVDALFGAGLARPLEGLTAAVVDLVNKRRIPCLAVDLPSGVNGDTGQILGVAIRAQATVTFFRRKFGHLLYPGRVLAGDVVVADIGIPDGVLAEILPRQFENAPGLWRSALRAPRWDDHKYKRGHLLIAGGDVMTGAARLAARAARRVGAGLVTVACSSAAHAIYALDSAGLITQIADSDGQFFELLSDPRRNALLIGPGHGTGARVKLRTLAILQTGRAALLDADALTSFAGGADEFMAALHSQTVLTPHDGEFARVFPDIDPQAGKLERARGAAKRSKAILVLKGPDTVIAAPDGTALINSNAPHSLATGGTGDVLAGMIAGLLAQGLAPVAAAAAGVWIHGAAAQKCGFSLIAEDIDQHVGYVMEELLGNRLGEIRKPSISQ
jgi:ADP-dependent NAD(P)H-hydrate dehydratase / NAD(P)H-hydrate epimerase